MPSRSEVYGEDKQKKENYSSVYCYLEITVDPEEGAAIPGGACLGEALQRSWCLVQAFRGEEDSPRENRNKESC